MIRDRDRSGYIGASDTEHVFGSWETKTFAKWWQTKTGYRRRHFANDFTMAGNAYEHKILAALSIPGLTMDDQKIVGRLRVNLDGFDGKVIYEVKTHRAKAPGAWKPPKSYYRQVLVQMYCFGVKGGLIVSYGLLPEDYRNFYRRVDLNRVELFPVLPDEEFLQAYLPRLHYLEGCLEDGRWPRETEVNNG